MVNVGPSFRVPARQAEVDYGPTPYLECRARACAFKVTSKDQRCPNCGTAMPHPASLSYLQSVAFDPRSHVGLFIFAFLAALPVLAAALSGLFAISFWSAYYPAFMLALFAVLIAYGVLRTVYSAPVRDEQTQFHSLAGSERRIRERLQEISRREGRILSVFARAKQSKGEDWQAVRRRLEDALATLRRQQARYQVKLFEIEAVRWQNRLAPFLYGSKS
jgi:membrane protein implicated in regulation of membrane protease activity